MATRTSVQSGLWSVAGTWDTGVPVDGDSVVIAAGHEVQVDVDQSAWTGLQGMTITSDATTPGMVYWKNGASGHLKFRTGYNIVGTNAAVLGRILVNSDGVWGNTGALQFSNNAVITLVGTAVFTMQYLEARFYCTEPTHKWVRTYGTSYTVTANATNVDTTLNYIDFASLTEGTLVRVEALPGGTLPEPLLPDHDYYTRDPSGTKNRLACRNTDDAIVSLTSTGSGTFLIYLGVAASATVLNVLEDVSGDDYWDNGDSVILANETPSSTGDVQRPYSGSSFALSSVTSSTVTLGTATDSAQCPGSRLYMGRRNVAIRCVYTTSVYAFTYSYTSRADNTTGSGVFNCEISNTGSLATTMYGFAIRNGIGHYFGGIVWGFGSLCGSSNSHVFDSELAGIVVACGYCVDYLVNCTISGTLATSIASSSNTAINSAVHGGTLSGEIVGCYAGITGNGMTVTGLIRNCTTPASGAGTVIARSGVVRNSGALTGSGMVVEGTIYACAGIFGGGYGSVATGATLGYLGHDSDVVYQCGGEAIHSSFGCQATLRGCRTHWPVRVFTRVVANGGLQSRSTQPPMGIYVENDRRVLGEHAVFAAAHESIKRTGWLTYRDRMAAVTTSSAAVNVRESLPANSAIADATKVRIAVRFSTVPVTMLNEVIGASIGVMTTGDTFDSTPTRITFNGGQNGGYDSFGLRGGNAVLISDEIDFVFDRTKRHGIHIAMNSGTQVYYYTANASPYTGPYNSDIYTYGTGDQTLTLDLPAGSTYANRTYLESIELYHGADGLRSGGASSIIEARPSWVISPQMPALLATWTEVDVPASAQSRTAYVRGWGWGTLPTASQLWLEAEYIGTDWETMRAVSDEALPDNGTWTALNVDFTPIVAGAVRYRIWLTSDWKQFPIPRVHVDGKLY